MPFGIGFHLIYCCFIPNENMGMGVTPHYVYSIRYSKLHLIHLVIISPYRSLTHNAFCSTALIITSACKACIDKFNAIGRFILREFNVAIFHDQTAYHVPMVYHRESAKTRRSSNPSIATKFCSKFWTIFWKRATAWSCPVDP